MQLAMMPPEDELCWLLVRARLSPEARERTLLLLAGSPDWPRLFERAKTYEIFPLLYAGLRTLGFPGVPDSVRSEWTKIFSLNAIRNELIATETARILRLAGDAGIPVIPLKGVALAESLYGDASLRACADIDVLVPPRHGVAAFHLMVSSGYQAAFHEPRLLDLLVRYGRDFMMMTRQASMGAYTLELHCGLLWGGPLERELLEEIWSGAKPLTFRGVKALSLDPEWEFLYLAVHAARHGGPSLKWLADLDRLCCRGTLDWAKVNEKARGLGWEPALHSTLAVCASLFETSPNPALGAPRMPAGSSAPSPAEVPSVSEILFSLRLLKTTSRRLRYVAIHLFIPTLADCEFLPLPASLFSLYYALRPFRVACNAVGWFVQGGLKAIRRAAG